MKNTLTYCTVILLCLTCKYANVFGKTAKKYFINIKVKNSPEQWFHAIGYWQTSVKLDSFYVVNPNVDFTLSVNTEQDIPIHIVPSRRGHKFKLDLENDTTYIVIDYNNTKSIVSFWQNIVFKNSESSSKMRDVDVKMSNFGWDITRLKESISYNESKSSKFDVFRQQAKLDTLVNQRYKYIREQTISSNRPISASMNFFSIYYTVFLSSEKDLIGDKKKDIEFIYNLLKIRFNEYEIFRLCTADYLAVRNKVIVPLITIPSIKN